MQFNRRGFMASVLAAIVGGSTVSVSKGALADPVIGKYAMAIKLQQALYADNKRISVARSQENLRSVERGGRPLVFVANPAPGASVHSPRLYASFAKLHTDADYLLTFLLDNFAGAEQTLEVQYQVSDLFDGRIKPDTLTIDGLQSLLDVVIPIAVAKRMLAHERIPLRTHEMPSFTRFVDAYKDLILDGKRRPHAETVAMFPEWAQRMGYKNG